jgi:hypothetical protein
MIDVIAYSLRREIIEAEIPRTIFSSSKETRTQISSLSSIPPNNLTGSCNCDAGLRKIKGINEKHWAIRANSASQCAAAAYSQFQAITHYQLTRERKSRGLARS